MIKWLLTSSCMFKSEYQILMISINDFIVNDFCILCAIFWENSMFWPMKKFWSLAHIHRLWDWKSSELSLCRVSGTWKNFKVLLYREHVGETLSEVRCDVKYALGLGKIPSSSIYMGLKTWENTKVFLYREPLGKKYFAKTWSMIFIFYM